VLVYFDRFVVGVLVSVGAVTFYATPYEVVTKAWIIPTAVSGVLFPAFASSVSSGPAQAGHLLRSGFRAMLFLMFPIAITLSCIGPFGLQLWLGSDFAAKSTSVMQWL